MIGHFEPEDLRRAEEQRGLDPWRLCRQSAFEEKAEQVTQRAEPAQHGRDQRTRERAVAVGERRETPVRVGAVELLVERAMAAQHAIENIGRDAASREAGNVGRGRWRCARCRHARHVA